MWGDTPFILCIGKSCVDLRHKNLARDMRPHSGWAQRHHRYKNPWRVTHVLVFLPPLPPPQSSYTFLLFPLAHEMNMHKASERGSPKLRTKRGYSDTRCACHYTDLKSELGGIRHSGLSAAKFLQYSFGISDTEVQDMEKSVCVYVGRVSYSSERV